MIDLMAFMRKKKGSKPTSRKVLFVCNGNIFRSFSAEALLKHYLDQHEITGWEVFSAGVTAKKEKIDPETLAKLRGLGITDLRHKQHKLNKKMLKKYDVVIAMAQDQVDSIKKKFDYRHTVLFNELVKRERSSITDIESVANYQTNRPGVEAKLDETVDYIHRSIPKLIEGIDERIYLFSEFAKGLRDYNHKNGFPFIKLYETPNTLAFMSISIPSKEDGHILVIPKERYVSFQEIPPKVLKELMLSMQKIGDVLERDHGGYNVLLNNGSAAGQYIFHAHFHLLPRNDGDRINLEGWIVQRMTKEQFVELNTRLKEKIYS